MKISEELGDHIALLKNAQYCCEQWDECNEKAHKLCSKYNLGNLGEDIHDVIHSELEKLIADIDEKDQEIRLLRSSDQLLKEIETWKDTNQDLLRDNKCMEQELEDCRNDKFELQYKIDQLTAELTLVKCKLANEKA